MDDKNISAIDTAMAVLVQPLVEANASGGGLSQKADGGMSISATWGLGEALAQGEVVPDRYRLTRDGKVLEIAAGRKFQAVGCTHHGTQTISKEMAIEPCLSKEQVKELGQYLCAAESIVDGPAEIEWSLDDDGFKLLQARPLHLETENAPDQIWDQHPFENIAHLVYLNLFLEQSSPMYRGHGSYRCMFEECALEHIWLGRVHIQRPIGPIGHLRMVVHVHRENSLLELQLL